MTYGFNSRLSHHLAFAGLLFTKLAKVFLFFAGLEYDKRKLPVSSVLIESKKGIGSFKVPSLFVYTIKRLKKFYSSFCMGGLASN